MYKKDISQEAKITNLKIGHLLVISTINFLLEKYGQANPSQRKIALLTGYHPRHISRLIGELCEMGLLFKKTVFNPVTKINETCEYNTAAWLKTDELKHAIKRRINSLTFFKGSRWIYRPADDVVPYIYKDINITLKTIPTLSKGEGTLLLDKLTKTIEEKLWRKKLRSETTQKETLRNIYEDKALQRGMSKSVPLANEPLYIEKHTRYELDKVLIKYPRVRFTPAAAARLSIFPSNILYKLLDRMSMMKALNDPFAWLYGQAMRQCKRNGIKLDWKKCAYLKKKIGFTTDMPLIEPGCRMIYNPEFKRRALDKNRIQQEKILRDIEQRRKEREEKDRIDRERVIATPEQKAMYIERILQLSEKGNDESVTSSVRSREGFIGSNITQSGSLSKSFR